MESDQVFSPFHMIDHALSLQQVANHLNEDMDTKPDSTLFNGMFLAVPVLMTLAVEIALKALKCQEDKEKPNQVHNLVNLFKSLSEDTQTGLKERLPITLDAVSLKLGVQDSCPVGAGIERVLEYHQNTFRDWRYLYEKGGENKCYVPELNNVLMAILETYEERVAAETISKERLRTTTRSTTDN